MAEMTASVPLVHGAIPLIDAAALAAARSADDAAVAALRAACLDTGFFLLTNLDALVPSALVSRALDAADEFFARPEPAKLRHASRAETNWRGFTPFGGGHDCSPASARPERKETYYWGDAADVGGARARAAPEAAAEIAALDDACRAFHAAMLRASRAVLRGLSLALGLAPDALAARAARAPAAKVLIAAYDPVARGGGACDEISCGAHTDCGFLTMLCSRGGRGLQVRRRADGAWLELDSGAAAVAAAAAAATGGGGDGGGATFVCNLGDLAQRLSRGAYASTPHRVLNDSAERRVSLIFFNNLDPSAPCDGIVGGGDEREGGAAAAAAAPALTCGEYVAARLAYMRSGYAPDAEVADAAVDQPDEPTSAEVRAIG